MCLLRVGHTNCQTGIGVYRNLARVTRDGHSVTAARAQAVRLPNFQHFLM